ncbi:MAG TPA: FxsA family protein [Kofleriaceae bacterium]|nr:FxsA family protein [Kofleriaceae bacterium]
MCGILALLFIVVPALEILVIIEVGGILGALPTLGVIIVTGLAGAALAKHQGLAAMRQVQGSMGEGREMGLSMVSAALVLVAGVMMLTPGFITDTAGILLLVPPVRRVAARRLVAWGRRRVVTGGVVMGGFPPPERRDDDLDPPPPGVIDV